MRFGLPISILLHTAILFWALFSVSARVELKPVQEVPIAVELLNVSEFSDLRAGNVKAKAAASAQKKEEKKPEAKEDLKKKERVAVLPPKAEEPKPEEPKKEEPKKEEPKKEEVKKEEPKKEPPKAEPDPIAEVLKKAEEPKKEEVKKEEPKKEEVKKEPPKKEPPKKVEAKKETKKKKEESFEDTVAALLNKVPNPSSASSSSAEADPAAKPQKALGGENATGSGLTVNERELIGALIRGKIRDERCWNPPVGSTGADQIMVRLRFKLRPDGSVDGVPAVLNDTGSQQFVPAAEAAVRAILNCSPYDALAQKLGHLYADGWNTVTVNFRPDQMFGG